MSMVRKKGYPLNDLQACVRAPSCSYRGGAALASNVAAVINRQDTNGKESRQGSASIYQRRCQSTSCAFKGTNPCHQNQQADEAFGRFNPSEGTQARHWDWSSAIADCLAFKSLWRTCYLRAVRENPNKWWSPILRRQTELGPPIHRPSVGSRQYQNGRAFWAILP